MNMTSENDPFAWAGFETDIKDSIKKVSEIVEQEIKKSISDPDVKIQKIGGRWFLTGPKSKINEFETRVMSRCWNDGGVKNGE